MRDIIMEYILSDIIELIGGGTPKTSVPEYWGGDIPWLSVKDFSGDKRYVYQTEKTITEEGVNNSSTKYLNQDDIIVSARGTVGELAMIPFPMTFNQSCYGIRAKRQLVDPFYLYYLMKYNLGELKSKVHGSVFDTITKDTFKQISVDLPELHVQKKVADILGNLDDKIETNEKINRNLSEQLKLLFEDMFITKADNTWADKKLGDFLDLERGLSYKGKFLSEGEGVPMLNLGNILPNSVFRPEKLKFYTGEFKPRNVVKPGDIIVANTDLTQAREVLGSAIRVPNLGYDTAICSHHISIVRNCTISNNFILGLLNMPAYRTRVAGFATGTTVLALPNDTILNCEFKCPPKELLKIYDEISEPIYMNMEEIRLENDKLAEIRDSLLPKLMSGELDISELDYE